MSFEKYLSTKDAFIFELDNVLYPEKDYLLQVYYLYAQFLEYGEQIDAADILKFMEAVYLKEGKHAVYEQTSMHFNIPDNYQVNFDLLLNNARLPLKLLIFAEVLSLLQTIVLERKQIFLFIDGNPIMQLNKIRQIEWHGLESYLRVFFSAETQAKPSEKGLELIIEKHSLTKENILMIGTSENDEKCAANAGVEFLNVDKLLLT